MLHNVEVNSQSRVQCRWWSYLSYLEELFCELWPIIRSSLEMFPLIENELLGRLCWKTIGLALGRLHVDMRIRR